MKKREFTDIRFLQNPDNTLTLKHLTSEMTIPCDGGGYILNVPCGSGKSTGIISLVQLFPNEAFVIFEKTQAECDDLYKKLIAKNIPASEIIVVHSGLPGHDMIKKDPSRLIKTRVIITPNINLYTAALAILFCYNKGADFDPTPYLENVPALLKSDYARKFILIDEQPDFMLPYLKIGTKTTISHYGNIVKGAKNGIRLDSNHSLTCLSPDKMRLKYYGLLKSSKDAFYTEDNQMNRYREEVALSHIHKNYCDINKTKQGVYEIWHFLKDLTPKGMKSNIYLFDATGNVLGDYSKSTFSVICNNDKSYSSDIEFDDFFIPFDRWVSETNIDSAWIADNLKGIIETLEKQILIIKGKLLIVTWKYMKSGFTNPELVQKEIDIINILVQELDKRGLNGQYSIIYRGSGQDKATNAYADYAGITFLGEWKTDKSNVSLLKKNYGMQTKEVKVRLAAMIQTVCRIRIRKHSGEKIWVFYSSDIDKDLIGELFDYFVKNSEEGCQIAGVARPFENGRDRNFLEKVIKLCQHDPSLLKLISEHKPSVYTIKLDEIHSLLKFSEKSCQTYHRSLRNKLQDEYLVTLAISSKRSKTKNI